LNRTVTAAALAAVFLTSAAGCGTETTSTPRGRGSSTPGRAPETERIDPYGDPVVYPRDPFEGFPVINELDYPGEPGSCTEPPSGTGAWSVQIAACAGESDAARLGAVASSLTGLPFFVDREDVWWKVRLGSYSSAEDAAAGLATAVGSGYSDAWIVRRLP